MRSADQLAVCVVALVSLGVTAPMSLGLINSVGFLVDASPDFWNQQVLAIRMSTSYAATQVDQTQ
jgi:hypothetical protein